MKLGFGDGEEISFAQNKELDDQCIQFEAEDEGVGMLNYGPSADDNCKFWVCEEEADFCSQHDASLYNVYVNPDLRNVKKYKTFNYCAQQCECVMGEVRYWTEVESEIISVCCDGATEFSDLTPVFDAKIGVYKLGCTKRCIGTHCDKWYCSGGGSCEQWTSGEEPSKLIVFYDEKPDCEAVSKCGQWWCNGSGVCTLIDQGNAAPSAEENWSGEIFQNEGLCEEFGCGKYFCSLSTQTDGDFLESTTGECWKVDGTNGAKRSEGATLFDLVSDCTSVCGKWYCTGAPAPPAEPIPCSRVMSNSSAGPYSGLFEGRAPCENESGCSGDYKWICSEGTYCQRLTESEAAAAGLTLFDWASGQFTESDCRLANQGCCPPGNQYNPATDQCVPV